MSNRVLQVGDRVEHIKRKPGVEWDRDGELLRIHNGVAIVWWDPNSEIKTSWVLLVDLRHARTTEPPAQDAPRRD